MTPHSVLFNSIVDREDCSRTASPSSGVSSRMSPAISMLRTTNLFWAGDRGHGTRSASSSSAGSSAYSLNASLPPPFTTTQQHCTHQSVVPPAMNFTGLISMYEALPQQSHIAFHGQIPKLGVYHSDWAAPNMTQYDTCDLQHTETSTSPWHPDGKLSQQRAGMAQTQHFAECAPSLYAEVSSSPQASSPKPTYNLTPPLSSAPLPLTPLSQRPGATDPIALPKSCSHCHVTRTPLWRRHPSTSRPLCNACGLYLQQHSKLRPQALIDADIDDDESQIPDAEYTGPRCSHCNTRQTSVWRRNKMGAQVCNACGVYARLRGKERPLSLKRNKIKPRTKHAQQ